MAGAGLLGSAGLPRTVISASRHSSVSLWYSMDCFCCSVICFSKPRTSGWLSGRLLKRLRGTESFSAGKHSLQFIKDNDINYWPTPAESPDMNPIESLWHELKHFLRTTVKPKNKEELVAGIQRFWDTVTPEKCRRYIGHLAKVIPTVIKREGRASGY